MSIAFRSATSGSGSAASIVVTKPSGVVSGDVLITMIQTNGAPTITPPSGWSLVIEQDRNSGVAHGYIYRKVAGGSEPADYTFSLSASGAFAWGCAAYTGVDNTTPVDVSASQEEASQATYTGPSATTTVADTMLLGIYGARGTNTWANHSASFTERLDTAYSANASCTVWDLAGGAAGAKGPYTVDLSVSGGGESFLVALKPAAAAGVTRSWGQVIG